MNLESFNQDKFIVEEEESKSLVGGGISYSYRYYQSIGYDLCYTTDADACDMCIE